MDPQRNETNSAAFIYSSGEEGFESQGAKSCLTFFLIFNLGHIPNSRKTGQSLNGMVKAQPWLFFLVGGAVPE